MNKKFKINAITEGAIYVAIYGVLSLVAKLTGAVDSIIYYFAPLPLAIYARRQDWKYVIPCLFSAIAVSFLFANPLTVVMLLIPNIIVGFIFGILDKYLKHRLVTYLITLVLLIAADYLSIALYEQIVGTSYWADMDSIINVMSSLFPNVDASVLNKCTTVVITVTIIVDSIMKLLMLVMLYSIIIIRLKLVPNYQFKIKFLINYNPINTILYLLFLGLMVFSLSRYIIDESLLFEIILIISLTLVFIYGIFIMYQGIFFIRIKMLNYSNLSYILVSIIAIILFPITIVLGLILNLIRYNCFVDQMRK